MNSPLLAASLQQISERDYFEILDPMPVTGQLLELCSAFHCKLYLPACFQGLAELDPQRLDTETKRNLALIKMLGFKRQQRASLNLILLWDLPNYLDVVMLRALIESLLPHCSKQTIVHSYISTREKMPAAPARYRLTGDKRVSVEQTSSQTRPSPMYYQESLQKAMSPFMVQKGILLSSGMQEYVMQWR